MVKIYLIAFSLFFANGLLATGLKSFSAWGTTTSPSTTVSSGPTVKTNSTFYDYSLVPKYQQYMKGFWCANTVPEELNDGQYCDNIQDRSVTFWINTPPFKDNLLNLVAAETPTLETSASHNDWPICRFDGIDDHLATNRGTTVEQPYMVCGVINGSFGALTRAVIFNSEVTGSPYARIWNGIFDGYAGNILAGTNVISTGSTYSFCYTFAGATGEIRVSGTNEASGNIGTTDLDGMKIYERAGPGGFNLRGIFLVMARYQLNSLNPNAAATDWLNFTVARYGTMDVP